MIITLLITLLAFVFFSIILIYIFNTPVFNVTLFGHEFDSLLVRAGLCSNYKEPGL